MVESLARLRGTIGVWSSAHEDVTPKEAGALVAHAEASGFAAYWFPESWFRESLTSATMLLAGTERLTVATGITSIWGRDAVSALSAARTLNAAYDDRFVLGLGVSHSPLVERLRSQTYTHPLERMTAFLDAMDAAKSLSPEAQHPYARVLAALGPRMLDLAATRADGAHTYLVDPTHTAGARARLGEGFLAVEQAVALSSTRDVFFEIDKGNLEFYTGLENYRANWRRLGFTDDDFVRGGSDRLCDAMVVHDVGDGEQLRRRVGEHRDAGADHVCLQVLYAPGESPVADWQRCAEALA